MDFQFDSTVDGKAIKIASMVDEHTRESLMNLVERSITAERLVADLERVFAAAGGPPMVLRMDNGPELVSQALQQFCDGKVGLSYIPPGTWNNGYIESFNDRPPTDAMPQRPPPRPNQVLVGHAACLGHGGGGHTSWHCRNCDALVYGPPLNTASNAANPFLDVSMFCLAATVTHCVGSARARFSGRAN